VEPLFGTSLEDIMERPDHAQYEVPIIVEHAVSYLIEKKCKLLPIPAGIKLFLGNTVQGIFRLSGSNQLIAQLRQQYDKGNAQYQ
jgi:hypothetical protein